MRRGRRLLDQLETWTRSRQDVRKAVSVGRLTAIELQYERVYEVLS